MEVRAGEAGVLRAALGEVQGMAGIDAKVRLYLWSGGVVDATLPVLDGTRHPAGAQVVVMFLSDRPESGVVLGAVEGNLSWRRLGPPAWAQQVQPALERVLAQAVREPGRVTVTPGFFPTPANPELPLTRGCVLLADGRVFFTPLAGNSDAWVLDPDTLALHAVPWPGTADSSFLGGCLLLDGRVFVPPGPGDPTGQAYLYDPVLDRVTPAGAATGKAGGGCTLLPDGRVFVAPGFINTDDQAWIYDPATDHLAAVALGLEPVRCLGVVLLPDGRVLLPPVAGVAEGPGAAALIAYDPTTATTEVLAMLGELASYRGGVLLADGRVLLAPDAVSPALVVNPATGVLTMVDSSAFPLGWRGGLLLPDGRALLLPDVGGGAEPAVYDPVTNALAAVPELAGLDVEISGGCALPDGRVLFGPGRSTDLVVWDPGCGVGLGRDVVLSGWWNRG